MTISLLGGVADVSPVAIRISHSPLHAALYGQERSIPLAQPQLLRLPTAVVPGVVQVGEHVVEFPPNHAEAAEAFVAAVQAALRGESPAVMGLDFCGIDVETANDDWGSICQVGVAVVKDGRVVDTHSWLCQPPIPGFAEINTQIHGIVEADVATAPTFAEVLTEVVEVVGQNVVVAHNAQFDMTAFLRACTAAGVHAPKWRFACSLAASRAAKLGISSHRLNVVAQHVGAHLEKHHDACSDARACAEILVALAQRAHVHGDIRSVFAALGFDLGTLEQARVYPVLSQPPSVVLSHAPAAKAKEAPAKKTAARSAKWSKAAAPEVIPETNPDADPTHPLFGHIAVLTGDFEPFDKGLLWQKMADAGATVAKNVTKKTTLLVMGPWDSVTSKQKRAEELITQGQSIQMWESTKLFEVLGLDVDLQPPF
ncbi:exonuclease domain-containing protein [Corynebacterium felinum]|uniref:DNA polymerase-3 subunit epsilon n=1 Tax=Corynebacterium felinum TaxID=131318 RepID=A0ABU2BBX0_9CORY|nr:exonuclease domain-containing protein [Corynebacterium felinum]MDF5819524.1 exonuclease domain-containing protein [Corynebacterium felinum]MDR7356093.1 DNA polymerase-3 subunit epsilon [Corynebacterium felinum]